MKPLTAEEIAELRSYEDKGTLNPGELAKVLDAAPRLLDEVEQWRSDAQSRSRWGQYLLHDMKTKQEVRRQPYFKDRARALLKRIEWSALKDHTYSACPACDGRDTKFHDYDDDPVGHKPGCELHALIG